MKATGVVRRIDDLGRIVIPKEIRKTLRIKEGDPLEIFTDREGQVILKKYSPIGELSEFAAGYAETLSKTTGHIACITDKDTIIAVSGGSKKEFLEQDVSKELEQLMEDKEVYTSKENSDVSVPITKNDNNERKYKTEIEPEIKNIKKLKQTIDDYTDGKEQTIKIVMLDEFSKELDGILDLYRPNFLGKKEEQAE